jgi:protein-arginine kinase activator protein McsA
MKCQRCFTNEANYRVYSDILDLKVCVPCAKEAGRLGISAEVLHSNLGMKSHPVLCAQE